MVYLASIYEVVNKSIISSFSDKIQRYQLIYLNSQIIFLNYESLDNHLFSYILSILDKA
jgi:hypothetical protein